MDINTFVLSHETLIRIGFFFGVLVLIASWEVIAPRRQLTVSKAMRWTNNLGLVFMNTLLLRLAIPAAAIGFAHYATSEGWGIFNIVELPFWFSTLVCVILLDLVIWLQHVMVHAIPLFWRFHRMHHADLDYDLTTGARFHPVEMFLSMGVKFAAIALLGPPLLAVVIFEVLLNATAMFNHGNIRLPAMLDRWLRWLLVTPDMHRVHHSVEDDEANSNFGFCLSWWDRLFGTYRDQPRGGHEGMTIGIRSFREPRDVSLLPGMLLLPFRGRIHGYTINRRQWSDHE